MFICISMKRPLALPSMERDAIMNPNNPNKRKSFTARRLVLLASVAGVGAALMLSGPGGYSSLPAWTATAATNIP